ncbi:hypothetical protein [Streptosporangium sp. NPDC002524]|uniref:hypothetical protein n=1 Tax=Streptosporangium sp. NPDC002524 TaxID=3154537 RepID=UPI00331F3AFE
MPPRAVASAVVDAAKGCGRGAARETDLGARAVSSAQTPRNPSTHTPWTTST